LFWDDLDKLKLTDFKTEVLFDVVDSLYRQKQGLTFSVEHAACTLAALSPTPINRSFAVEPISQWP